MTSKEIIQKLNALGKLPENFDENSLIQFLSHPSDKIRFLAVKNLAKLCKISLLNIFIQLISNEKSSLVRRESVSAIGRLKDFKICKNLLILLEDDDPEIVLQAIRGLLVFKEKEEIKNKLISLKNHPNEIVREVIAKEFHLNKKNYQDKNHPASPDHLKNKIIQGDVQKILKNVSAESIHLTFTSPPYYNARDYSTYKSYSEYLDFLEKIFKEVHRITKEGRFFVLNTSPVIIPRVGRNYSSKRYPIPYDIHPLLVKMGWEFIDDIVWIKPEASVKNRNAGFLQHRKPLAYKPNPCSESVMVYRKKTDKLIDWNIKQYDKKTVEQSKILGKYETSNLWKIDPTFDKVHSAVFPLKLCKRVIQFYSFKGDLVFDPFAGSGTVGKAAMQLKRYFFLTEKKEEYVERMKESFGGGGNLLGGIVEFIGEENFKK